MLDFTILAALNSLEYLVVLSEANRMGIIPDEPYKEMLKQLIDARQPKSRED